MAFGFDNFTERTGYLKQAGLHTNSKLLGLTYVANEKWEAFDIEIETEDGKLYRERTFGANPEKVFPRDKWEAGVNLGKETMQEAYERVQEEIAKKLYYLGSCFVKPDELKEAVGTPNTLKQLIERVNKAIDGKMEQRINFLTIWKNNDSKQTSVLILANKGRWCEATRKDGDQVLPAGISLSASQKKDNMVEKYPYNGNRGEAATSNDAFVGGSTSDDLPF